MIEMQELFHGISQKRKNYFSPMLEQYDLNLIEIEILVFLVQHPDSNTFTQIMQAKDYAKSHISNAVNRLVEGGYLERQGVPHNKKIHQLYPLIQSDQLVTQYHQCIQRFHADAFDNIDPVDIETFCKVINQMSQNLSKPQE